MVPIDYVCFLNHTGYSQGAVDSIMSLTNSDKFDIKITCINGLPDKASFTKEFNDFLLSLVKKKTDQNAVQIFQCVPAVHRRYNKLKKSMSYGIFETFDPPNDWIQILNRMDAVICPSLFSFNQFAQNGISKPMYYIPHAVDTSIWNDTVKPLCNYDKFTFLFVGTWRRRKGWPELIEAWMREFRKTDNVQLLIKTDKLKVAKKDIDLIRRNLGISEGDYANIIIEHAIYNENILPRFYKSADCLILPTLGEGFGLPPMQCMAMKVPVIVTDFSGCQDYANEDRCTLLKPSGFIEHPMMDNIQQFRDKKWPRITVNEITKAMKFVLENNSIVSYKSDNAYEYVRENFNYKRISDLFSDMMEEVYGASILETQPI